MPTEAGRLDALQPQPNSSSPARGEVLDSCGEGVFAVGDMGHRAGPAVRFGSLR
jgi:hypothetical protein